MAQTYSNRNRPMTDLSKTELTTSLRTELALQAATFQGQYGAMTELAADFGVSRPTVYAAAGTAVHVVDRHFEDASSGGGGTWVFVDGRLLERAIVALRTMAPNSLRAIENLLPILYPGVRLSYGKIQGVAKGAEGRAAKWNRRIDLSGITEAALDEMYSQGTPVLAGVDLDIGYLFVLAAKEARGGAEWAEELRVAKEQGVDLKVVVKDAAPGIRAGVSAVAPEAEQRDDAFHALYEMGKVRRMLEQRAFSAMALEMKAEEELRKAREKGKGDLRGESKALRDARKRCMAALTEHDDFEGHMGEAAEAMEFVDPDTARIRDAEEMERMLEAAGTGMMDLPTKRCRKVGRYIFNRAPGLALHMREMEARLDGLAGRYGEDAVRMACVAWRLRKDLDGNRRPWDGSKDRKHLAVAEHLLGSLAGTDAVSLTTLLEEIVAGRNRASSAIEGFNAALRPFLYVHKGVTDGFLELFRAYYNLRIRRWGRHKGTSPHQMLTDEPVGDWLSMLGYPPSDGVN